MPTKQLPVMNRDEYLLSQHIPMPQPYNAYAHQDASALTVILLPQYLLGPLLYVLKVFTRLFT